MRKDLIPAKIPIDIIEDNLVALSQEIKIETKKEVIIKEEADQEIEKIMVVAVEGMREEEVTIDIMIKEEGMKRKLKKEGDS